MTTLIEQLEKIDRDMTTGEWVVCPDPPPNDEWRPGTTVGIMMPDGRRVCDTSGHWCEYADARENAAGIVSLRNALPAIIAALKAGEELRRAADAMYAHQQRISSVDTRYYEQVYVEYRAALESYRSATGGKGGDRE